MSAKNISAGIDALFNKMQGFISTKTVVGEPVIQGGVIIVPLIDVKFGMGYGAYDAVSADGDKDKASGKAASESSGGAMGGTISPSAVLVIVDGNVSLVNIKNQNSLNKLIDLAPGLVSKLQLDKFLKKGKSEPEGFDDDIEI